ncbi:hypothetical protein R50072_05470 [Simiduia litorea]
MLLLALLPILFNPSFSSLFHKWTQWSEGLSHGFLLIGIFVYLVYAELPFVYQRCAKLHTASIGLGLAFFSLCWALFALIDFNLLAELSLLALLFFAIAYIYGPNTAWSQRFLLAIPIFAITLWDQLNGGLVNLSGLVVGELVRMFGIPAVIDGNSIFIPYGHIVIADGCSGLRYFIIALAMGYLISYLNGYREKQLVPVLLIAALLALVTNWIRIFILILVGFYTEMQSSLMNDHDLFGWLLFAGICLPALYFAPVRKRQAAALEANGQPTSIRILMALLLLSAGPLMYLIAPSPSSETSIAVNLPISFKPASDNSDELWSQNLAQEVPSEWNQYFTRAQAQLTITSYRRAKKGEKLVPYIGSLYPSSSWSKAPIDNSHFRLADATAELQHKTSGKKVLQIQWFQVGDFHSASSRVTKLLQVPALLAGKDTFRLITLTQPCDQRGCTTATESLSTMAAEIHAAIKE